MAPTGTILLFLACAVLIGAISVPMIRGRVPPNPLYGFRTPETLEDETLWYPANRYAGQQMFNAAVIQAAGNLLLLGFSGRLSTTTVMAVGIGLLTITTLVALIRSFSFLSRLQGDR